MHADAPDTAPDPGEALVPFRQLGEEFGLGNSRLRSWASRGEIIAYNLGTDRNPRFHASRNEIRKALAKRRVPTR